MGAAFSLGKPGRNPARSGKDRKESGETMIKTLFWSERGAIACEKHAPFRGSDSWVWERWERVPHEAYAETAFELQCETCAAKKQAVGT